MVMTFFPSIIYYSLLCKIEKLKTLYVIFDVTKSVFKMRKACVLSWGAHGWLAIWDSLSQVHTFQKSWTQFHSYVSIYVNILYGKRSKRSMPQLSWFAN